MNSYKAKEMTREESERVAAIMEETTSKEPIVVGFNKSKQNTNSVDNAKYNYHILIKYILGEDYCKNNNYDAACRDIMKKIDNIKYDLKMWRNVALVMLIISILLILFK